MKNVTPENLKDFQNPMQYKKALKKDQKYLTKCKGIIVVNEYKFGGKKKGMAMIFTKKAKEAKDAFKSFKADKSYPAAAKMGAGTCEVTKNENGELEMKIDLKQGGLAPEVINTKGKRIFNNVLNVKAEILSTAPKTPEAEKENTAPVNSQATHTDKTEEQLQEMRAIFLELRTELKDIRQQAGKLKEAAKVGASADDYNLAEEAKAKVKAWVQAYNKAPESVKQKVGDAPVFMKKFWHFLKSLFGDNPQPAPPKPDPQPVDPDPQPESTIDTSSIVASVGQGGANRIDDVKIIQTLLNEHKHGLLVDGLCGKKTINAIKDFQANVMKSSYVDGLVNKDQGTWNALKTGKLDETELRDKDKGKYDHTRLAMDLFVKGAHDDHEIDENDIQQGQIGDCYFMSAVAAVAKTNPEAIKKLIKTKGDGSYDVTLYAKGDRLALKPTIINVKPDFVTDENGNPIYADKGDKELWVMLLEKAYAKMHGGYDDIGEGGYIEDGLEAITGQDAKYYMMYKYDSKSIKELMLEGLKAKKPMTAATKGSGEEKTILDSGTIIYKGHAYSVEKISGNNIEMRNPWGFDHATVTFKELLESFDHIAF
ncbi:MAG: C2 family cysteine protease [Saprospiraceae bacterium]|nr:C2 family cysteine protease [Saprospiraceae bacterium]